MYLLLFVNVAILDEYMPLHGFFGFLLAECYGYDRRASTVRTRPSCIIRRSTIDTTVLYTTVVYMVHTTVVPRYYGWTRPSCP